MVTQGQEDYWVHELMPDGRWVMRSFKSDVELVETLIREGCHFHIEFNHDYYFWFLMAHSSDHKRKYTLGAFVRDGRVWHYEQLLKRYGITLTVLRDPAKEEEMVNELSKDCYFRVEYLERVWTVMAYKKDDVGMYFVGPFTLDLLKLLRKRGITPILYESNVQFKADAPEHKLAKYLMLDYHFEARKRWRKTFLYAWKWLPNEKRRETKYIGPWNDKMKKLARELNLQMPEYK
jgi:hypothetical protein